MTTRLLIVDDQTAIRQALQVMLGLAQDIEVVATAADGRAAIAAVEEHHPDVVLMDLNMPVMGGVEATEAIHAAHPDLPVIALTTFNDDESILAVLRAGARGYLTKDADRAAIAQAVLGAHAGHAVLDPGVQSRLLELAGSRAAPIPPERRLTERENEILRLIGRGLKNPDIARELGISQATVKTHINNLFAKADLRSRADAVRLALTGETTPATSSKGGLSPR
jgi:DNA-binding NarL/FixJ family response regulator